MSEFLSEFFNRYLNEFFNDSFAGMEFSSFSFRMGFMDYVDIIIVAFFTYKLMLWIKETRAWTLFKGIIAILAISVLSFSLGLTTISWLVKSTMNIGILAIVVLFQPEIRRSLEQLGKGRIIVPFVNDDNFLAENAVEELLKAIFAMHKTKTGALIVVENQVKLREIYETGTIIDSTISSELIMNIFYDKSPLHDGAMVVGDNRIAAASCILPLTDTEIGKELGTRHRAAVGMSENSDAFIIVVSEETGKVSLAHSGKLYKNQTYESLRAVLLKKSTNTKKFVLKKVKK